MNSLLDRPATDILLCYEFVWPNYIYLVCIIVRADMFQPVERCISVEVFRLPSVSGDYRTQTYIHDFLEFIHSDRKKNPDFKYELIYADLPSKPGGNLTESKPPDDGTREKP
jgi:hypothetical protein